jgi:GNAT superfamily N-acetyltransferase
MGSIETRVARPDDLESVALVLREAAAWLDGRGMRLWAADELEAKNIAADVDAGQYVVALDEGVVVGTLRFTLDDELFWPDAAAGEAAYVHRLAVRRSHAGTGVSTRLLDWAAARALACGRKLLRLDCEAHRVRLRALYERHGFGFHSERAVGPYFVARYEKALSG